MIDWQTEDNVVLVNPRFPQSEAGEIQQELLKVEGIRGHLWIATSGSTAASVGAIKWTALSKRAILTSAEAVNTFLKSDRQDIWLNALPSFHVGGVGILARAHLSGARVIKMPQGRWEAESFSTALYSTKATLTALVPAQLYDLVSQEIQPPPTLRAVIIGGGALQEPLYKRAVALGWKLLQSYGLTECASQVATAELSRAGSEAMAPLKLLPHVEVKLADSGCLQIRSPALLTCYAFKKEGGLQLLDPKKEGWFVTEDRGFVSDGFLQVLGREAHFVKIGGESCDLLRLERILEELKLEQHLRVDTALVAVLDARLGHVIHLTVAGQGTIDALVEDFQKRVLPFERIRKVHYLPTLPRTVLSKLILPELKRLIGER